MSWNRFDMSERPLPKKGCSWAFYLLLVVLGVFLLTMYIKYRQSM